MTSHEEQESQVVDPSFNLPSSPSSLQGAGHTVRAEPGGGGHTSSDDTTPDPNLQEPEAQNDSIRSLAKDTQLSELYPETQQFDEPEPVFQNPTKLSQHITTLTHASAAIHTSPLPFAAVERPKASDPTENEGFKFSKAQKAQFTFGRHPGRATDLNTNTSQPATSSGTSEQDPLPQAQSSAQPVPLPSKAIQNEPPQSGKMTAPSHTAKGKHGRPLPTTNTPKPPSIKPMKQKNAEPPWQRAVSIIDAPNAPMLQSASPSTSPTRETESYPDQLLSRKVAPKAANKSNMRSNLKQAFPPFPDVLQRPCRRNSKGNTPATIRPAIIASSHPLQHVDSNARLHDEVPVKQYDPTNENAIGASNETNKPVAAIVYEGSSRPSALSFSYDNTDTAQQMVMRDNLDYENGPGIRAGAMPPPAFSGHPQESQQGWSPVSGDHEEVLPRHPQEEALHAVESQTLNVGHGDLQGQTDGEVHQQSEPPSGPPSRPQSALRNTARPMVRPLAAGELVPKGVPEQAILHSKLATKIQKSSSVPSHTAQRVTSNPENGNQRPNPSPASSIKAFRQNFDQIEEVLAQYENQKGLIESQQAVLQSKAAALEVQRRELESQQTELESRQAEINELKDSTLKSQKQIRRLEEEKMALATKVKKFAEISTKYKAHMNEVVVAQKHLMAESKAIKETSAKIREESKAVLKAHTDLDNHESKLRSLINDARFIQPKIEELEKENTKCKTELENAEKNNVLLQSDLNARMIDLGRERHNAGQLQKNLNAQSETYKELVETLQKSPSAIVDELTKEGSVLAILINSENSIRAKIDELSAFLNTVNSREPGIPPALIKLIEDLYTRIENRLQAKENTDVGLNGSNLKLFEDLKERINQLRLDGGTKESLNERISELRESNAALMARESAKDVESQGLLKRIEELELELSGCRDQLTVKLDELATLRALPKEDPVLLRKINDLENAKTILEGQLNSVDRELSKAKDELASCREMALSAQEQSRELQGKLTEAETFLKTLQEDRKKYLASHKADVDKARQDIAKSANTAKIETQMKHDSLVKNLEEARSEAEKELSLVHEELQRCQEESASYSCNLNKVQEELSACKKQLTQQAVYIKHVEQRSQIRDELDRRESTLQQALKDMVDVKIRFNAVQSEISRKLEGLGGYHKQTEKLIQRVDALEKENLTTEEEKCEIQKTLEALRANVSQYLRRNGVLVGEQPIDDIIAALSILSPRKMAPPAISTQNVVINQPSLASSDLTPSHSQTSDDLAFTSSLSETPKKVLRLNEQKQGPSQRITSLQHVHDATPISNPLTKSRMTTGTTILSITNEAVESSTHFFSQSSPKPLRPANRKPSGLTQPVQIEQPSASTQRNGAPTRSREHASSRANEQSRAAHPPTGMTPSSSGSPGTISRYNLGGSVPPRASAPGLASRGIDGLPIISQTSTATSTLGASLLTSSSSLSGLSMIDQLGFNDVELEEAYVQGRELKNNDLASKGNGNTLTSMQTSTATAVAGVHFKTTPSSYQLSDDDDLVQINARKTARPHVPSLAEESVRRRQSKPLKSAMRTSSKKQATTTTNEAEGDLYQIRKRTHVATSLQKPSSRATVNTKQQTEARKSSIGSTYNRIASGSKPDFNQSSENLSTAEHKSTANPIVSSSEKSPIMRAPARMARKRSASISDANSQPVKPPKQARVSLPNQGRRTLRTVIPDSQKAVCYRH